VLRVAGGVFYGLGDPPSEDPEMGQEASEETGETEVGRQRTPLTMIVPAAVLVAAAIGIAFAPPARPSRREACGSRTSRPTTPPCCPARTWRIPRLFSRREHPVHRGGRGHWRRFRRWRPGPGVPRALLAAPARAARGVEPGRGLTRPIAWFQSGVVNDHVTWVVIGLACLGGALPFAIR
jgi:hypothetical protein